MQYFKDDYKVSVVCKITFISHRNWCEILYKKNACSFNIINKNKKFLIFVKFIFKSHHN